MISNEGIVSAFFRHDVYWPFSCGPYCVSWPSLGSFFSQHFSLVTVIFNSWNYIVFKWKSVGFIKSMISFWLYCHVLNFFIAYILSSRYLMCFVYKVCFFQSFKLHSTDMIWNDQKRGKGAVLFCVNELFCKWSVYVFSLPLSASLFQHPCLFS